MVAILWGVQPAESSVRAAVKRGLWGQQNTSTSTTWQSHPSACISNKTPTTEDSAPKHCKVKQHSRLRLLHSKRAHKGTSLYGIDLVTTDGAPEAPPLQAPRALRTQRGMQAGVQADAWCSRRKAFETGSFVWGGGSITVLMRHVLAHGRGAGARLVRHGKHPTPGTGADYGHTGTQHTVLATWK